MLYRGVYRGISGHLGGTDYLSGDKVAWGFNIQACKELWKC